MSSKANVSMCMIVKNDESCLEKCLQSFRDYVEEIVIIDTGSTDRTPEIAKKYADIFEVYTGCNDENGLIKDFSNARNRSFELATKNWTSWCDSDDILIGAEKFDSIIKSAEASDAFKQHDAMCFMFKYEYAYSPSGEVICEHYRER